MAIQQNLRHRPTQIRGGRVFLRKGSGSIVVNGKPLDLFFGRETSRMIVRQPLELTQNVDKFDVLVTVEGGGMTGQAGAIPSASPARWSSTTRRLKSPLRKAGFMTRDAREVERRKVGLHKARRATQYSKR